MNILIFILAVGTPVDQVVSEEPNPYVQQYFAECYDCQVKWIRPIEQEPEWLEKTPQTYRF